MELQAQQDCRSIHNTGPLTQGPFAWGVYDLDEGIRIACLEEAHTPEQQATFAHLFAAAPELFEALEALFEWAILQEQGHPYVANMRKPVAAEKTRLALEKAKPGFLSAFACHMERQIKNTPSAATK